jgi:vancomycin resistance protein YoaR
MRAKRLFFLSALFIFQVFLSFFLWSALLEVIALTKITANAVVSGVPVRRMSFNQAEQALKKAYPSPAGQKTVFAAGEQELPVDLAELNAQYLYREALNEIRERQRPGFNPAKINRALQELVRNSRYYLLVGVDKDLLAGKIDELERLYARKPVDARLSLKQNGEIYIVPEEYGRAIDKDATQKKFSVLQVPLPDRLEAVISLLKPKITAKDLSAFKYILGEFQTAYDPGEENRTHNILVAVAAIDNTIIQPQQVFSFNEKIGQVTRDNGYQLAPVIKDNHYELDYGGGICQVSTTLYNAACLAGLEIIERHTHGIPVPYIESGQDATVAMGILDLKIKNDFLEPVYLKCQAENGRLSVIILGEKPFEKKKP